MDEDGEVMSEDGEESAEHAPSEDEDESEENAPSGEGGADDDMVSEGEGHFFAAASPKKKASVALPTDAAAVASPKDKSAKDKNAPRKSKARSSTSAAATEDTGEEGRASPAKKKRSRTDPLLSNLFIDLR